MRRMTGLLAIFVVLAALLLMPLTAHAIPVRVDTTALSQADPDLDGRTVRFTGEAIGETLRADSRTRWVNVLEDGVAIGVVAPNAMLEPIDGFGDWSRRGTIVEVTGVFNVACPQHGGDLDVHAQEIRILEPSKPIERPVQPAKAAVAALAFALAGGLFVLMRYLKRRAV